MNCRPQTLTTPRLTLRGAKSEDADVLFQNYCGVPECAQYLTRGVHVSPNQTAKFLNEWCTHAWSKAGVSFAWVIADRLTDLPIGTFVVVLDGDEAQIHFGIGQKYWGRGLVAEAGHDVVRWLFDQGTLCKLSTVCDAEHLRSQRVLEKLGFLREGLLPKHFVIPLLGVLPRDGIMYSRVKT